MGDNESWHDNVVLQLDVLRDTAAKTEDLVHAAQELATATKSESPNDQMSRQNALNDMGAGDLFLHRLSTSKVEMVQWWMSLALTQLVYDNQQVIESIVDFSVLKDTDSKRVRPSLPDPAYFTAKECLVAALASILRNERAYATDRVRYGCLYIATNIANANHDSHMVMFHHGLVKLSLASVRLGNTNALVSVAVGFLCCLSLNTANMHRLLKLGAMRGVRNVARAQKSELNSASGAVARQALEAYAASRVSAVVRGFLGRCKATEERRARTLRRLARFFVNAVVWKCFLKMAEWREDQIHYRANIKRAGALLFNSTIQAGFKALKLHAAKRRHKWGKGDAALSFLGQSPVSRDRLWEMWKEYMREHGAWWTPNARLEKQIASKCTGEDGGADACGFGGAQIALKCSRFVALMGGAWVALCFSEWKELLVKKARAMSRWKNSALHFVVDLWVTYMGTDGPWWEPDDATKRLLDEKCANLMAAMSGDYLRATLLAWADMTRKSR
ncbi:hypothetical protein T484DRAFT_1806631, partial [Baffinella frigidus]